MDTQNLSFSTNYFYYSKLLFSLDDLDDEDRHARLDAILPSTAYKYPCPYWMEKEHYLVIFLYNIQKYGWRKSTEKEENPPYPREYINVPWWTIKKVDGLWSATFDQLWSIRRDASRRKKKELKFVFLTISHSSNLENVLKHHDLMKSKKIMKLSNYYYSIEQRGETLADLGQGLHSHIIIKVLPKYLKNGNYQKSRLVKETANTYKVEKNFIDVKFIYTDADFDRTLKYISGIKKDKSKQLKVEMDKVFRSNNNLDIVYTNAKV